MQKVIDFIYEVLIVVLSLPVILGLVIIGFFAMPVLWVLDKITGE